jgi:hypothetical protein
MRRRAHTGAETARRALTLLTCAALVLVLGSCGDSNGGTALPSPLPTESVGPAVCDARDRVFDLVGEVQSGAIESKEDVAARLRDLRGQLDDQAEELRSEGQTGAADSVTALATAATELADAVEGADAAAIVSAAARAASAIQSIPGCPSPSPSPSPSPTASA